MPYDGSGTFHRNYNWVNDKNAAIPITASRMDADSNDFANGLSQVVTRDGQGASTSVLRINGIGATPFVGGGMSDAASAYLLLNKAGSAHTDSIFAANNGLTRWQLALADASPESGSNSGSAVALLRYNDAGAVIDTPLSVARNTGLTTIATLAVTNPIASNISLTGTLDVTGVATFHAQYGVQLVVPSGQIAEYRAVETGGRDFGFGNYGPGNYFRIVDYTANAERLTIQASGQVSMTGPLLIGPVADACQITAAAGGFARYFSTVTGARTWAFGTRSDATFSIEDVTGGAIRFQIGTGGAVTIPGSLTVSGSFNTTAIAGTTIIATTYHQTAPASGGAWYYATCASPAKQHQFGTNTDGGFYIIDNTAGANRLIIGTGGAVTIPGSLTVSGNIATNQINGTAIIASANFQCNVGATSALLYLQNSFRSWYIINDTAGTFGIVDNTGGAYRLSINTAGNATFANSLTVNGNFATNALSCSTINTNNNNLTMGTGDISCQIINATGVITSTAGNGIQCIATGAAAWHRSLVQSVRDWYSGCNTDGGFYIYDASAPATRIRIDTGGTVFVGAALNVGTTSTLNGTVSCNAISCSTINTNNNVITSGAINANGVVTVVNGVNYSNLGAHTIGFNNSGATLTFFALGGTTASWTFNVSDERLKENIGPARGDALDELRRLKLISFDLPFPDAPQHFECGFSAQDVQGIIPEAVVESNHAGKGEKENMVLSLDIVPLLARCIGAIQQLANRIETLEGMIVP